MLSNYRSFVVRARLPFFLVVITVWLGGCSSVYLKDGQYLLVKQKIKGNRKTDAYVYKELLQQEDNRRFLGFTPYVYFYLVGSQVFDKEKAKEKKEKLAARLDAKIDSLMADRERLTADSSTNPKKVQRLNNKIQKELRRKDKKLRKQDERIEQGNWLMRVVGEPPALYSPEDTKISKEKMELYLFKKGFFRGKVKVEVDTINGHNIKTKYHIKEGSRQRIRRINYEIEDAAIDSIVQANKGKSLLKPLDPYDEDKLAAERERIYSSLRNNGYYAFSRDYIFIESDTTFADNRRIIDLLFIIKNPTKEQHKSYRIGEMVFKIDPNVALKRFSFDTLVYNQTQYVTNKADYPLDVLDNRLRVHPGQLYNQKEVINTQSRLASLDMFKFVNMSFDTAATGGDIHINIYTTMQPRFEISQEVGLAVSQGPPGPFGNLTLKFRNPLGGFEVLQIGARASFEGQISPFLPDSVIYQAREAGVNLALTFPGVLFPLRVVKRRLDPYNIRTSFTFGATNVVRPEYTRNIYNASLLYNTFLNTRHQFSVGLIDINIIDTRRLNDNFREFLDSLQANGNSLIQSFRQSLVTNFNIGYTYNTTYTGAGVSIAPSKYLRVFLEGGGLITDVIDRRLTAEQNNILGLKPFRYWKIQADYRYYRPTNRNNTLVFRIAGGVVKEWGLSNTLPYEKFFFAGGSNSMRAWPPRRLGPGSYTPPLGETGEITYQAEQPGEMLLEGNIELRSKIVGSFEGALFLDAGNVWMLSTDNLREGAEFRVGDFYKDIALGTGAGLRLNFSFLIIRLDAGVKLYDPALPAMERWVIQEIGWKKPFGRQKSPVFNLAVGYPF